MARRKTDELQKHTLNLRSGDVDTLQSLFPSMQATVIIRRIVSKFVDKSKAAMSQPDPEIINSLSKDIDV